MGSVRRATFPHWSHSKMTTPPEIGLPVYMTLFQINDGLIGPVFRHLSCQSGGFRVGIPIHRKGGFPLLRQHNFPAKETTFAPPLSCHHTNLVVSRGHTFGARIAIDA